MEEKRFENGADNVISLLELGLPPILIRHENVALRQRAISRRNLETPGGVLKKALYREAPPRGPTPYPFIYHFFRKGTPFVYLLSEKGTTFKV